MRTASRTSLPQRLITFKMHHHPPILCLLLLLLLLLRNTGIVMCRTSTYNTNVIAGAQQRPDKLNGALNAERWLREQHTRAPFNTTPGISAVIYSHSEGTRLVSIGVQDAMTGVETSPNTLFEIGSISKTFVTLAIARLVEAGTIEWDSSVRSILGPQFALGAHEYVSKSITVRDLLSHRTYVAGSNTLCSVFSFCFLLSISSVFFLLLLFLCFCSKIILRKKLIRFNLSLISGAWLRVKVIFCNLYCHHKRSQMAGYKIWTQSMS